MYRACNNAAGSVLRAGRQPVFAVLSRAAVNAASMDRGIDTLPSARAENTAQ